MHERLHAYEGMVHHAQAAAASASAAVELKTSALMQWPPALPWLSCVSWAMLLPFLVVIRQITMSF